MSQFSWICHSPIKRIQLEGNAFKPLDLPAHQIQFGNHLNQQIPAHLPYILGFSHYKCTRGLPLKNRNSLIKKQFQEADINDKKVSRTKLFLSEYKYSLVLFVLTSTDVSYGEEK